MSCSQGGISLLLPLDLPLADGAALCIQERRIGRGPTINSLDKIEGNAVLQSVEGKKVPQKEQGRRSFAPSFCATLFLVEHRCASA